MTLSCSSQSTRLLVKVKRAFGVVVRTTDFLDTVVRLAWFSSTGPQVGPDNVGQVPLRISRQNTIMTWPSNQGCEIVRNRSKGKGR
jgi:hypothetical protein